VRSVISLELRGDSTADPLPSVPADARTEARDPADVWGRAVAWRGAGQAANVPRRTLSGGDPLGLAVGLGSGLLGRGATATRVRRLRVGSTRPASRRRSWCGSAATLMRGTNHDESSDRRHRGTAAAGDE
jgi:hypothetical protein